MSLSTILFNKSSKGRKDVGGSVFFIGSVFKKLHSNAMLRQYRFYRMLPNLSQLLHAYTNSATVIQCTSFQCFVVTILVFKCTFTNMIKVSVLTFPLLI